MTGLSKKSILLTLSDQPGSRLDKALADVVPEDLALSRSRISRLIEDGAVRREDGSIALSVKQKGRPGERWWVCVPEDQEAKAAPENIPLDVRFEDDHLIVVNKPAGMVVHPAPGSWSGTLVNALLHHCAHRLSGIGGIKRPGIVHRIDKETSGLLVVAKSDAAHHGLAAQFAKHSVQRHYRAFCYGVPLRSDPRLAGVKGVVFETDGTLRISGNIARHKSDRKRMAVVTNAGKHAITRVKTLQQFGEDHNPVAALLECWLETGRTHQIRVHLAHIGYSLVGDPTYGSRRKLAKKSMPPELLQSIETFPRQALHAATLGFVHPISMQKLSFEAEIPHDLVQLENSLRQVA